MNNLHTKILCYTGAAFLAIITILAVIISIAVSRDSSTYDQNTISVNGEAEVSGEPDTARFSFSISEIADTSEEAQVVVSQKVSSILDGLEDFEIEDKDVKTNSYIINPQYQWVKVDQKAQTAPDGTIYYPNNNGKQVLIGYDVRQEVQLILRDLDMAGDVLTLFAQQGVENVYGPNFEIEDPDGLQEEARLKAIVDAQEKAQRLADNLGVKLGDVVSFYENEEGGYYPSPHMAREEMYAMDSVQSAAPQLPRGENDIVSRVTITYRIK